MGCEMYGIHGNWVWTMPTVREYQCTLYMIWVRIRGVEGAELWRYDRFLLGPLWVGSRCDSDLD